MEKQKKILFMCALLYLSFPVLNTVFPIIKSGPLKGAYTYAEDTAFTWKGWWSGSFQLKREKYWNDHFGFRPDYIRIHNQIDYSLFNQTNVNDVVFGNNNYLFEQTYIESYNGKWSWEREKIDAVTIKIKTLQDSLEAHGKHFVFVIASGKAWFYPEYISAPFREERKITNYEQFLQSFDQHGVHYIDFNGWFMKEKSKSPYPLITQQGTHWSSYGAAVIMDSLQNYLQQQVYKRKLVDIQINCKESNRYNRHDREAGESLNLIFPLPCPEKTCHPQFMFDTLDAYKPTALIGADSYFWEPYQLYIPHNVFKTHEFWYYNNERWNEKGQNMGNPKDAGPEVIQRSDLMIMMASEFHIDCIIDGFSAYVLPGLK